MMNNSLDDLSKKLGDVNFVGGETIPPADAAQVAAKAAQADGLLLVWLSGHGGDYATLEKLNLGNDKPAVFYGDHMRGIKRLGDIMGGKVIEEDLPT